MAWVPGGALSPRAILHMRITSICKRTNPRQCIAQCAHAAAPHMCVRYPAAPLICHTLREASSYALCIHLVSTFTWVMQCDLGPFMLVLYSRCPLRSLHSACIVCIKDTIGYTLQLGDLLALIRQNNLNVLVALAWIMNSVVKFVYILLFLYNTLGL